MATLNKHERRHLETLRRRAAYLRERLGCWPADNRSGAKGYVEAEATALEWAVAELEDMEDVDDDHAA